MAPPRRPGRTPPAARHQPQWSPPIPIVAASDAYVDGAALNLWAMRQPTTAVPVLWATHDGVSIGHVASIEPPIHGTDALGQARELLVLRCRLDAATARGRQVLAAHGRGDPIGASISFTHDRDALDWLGRIRDWRLEHVAICDPATTKPKDPHATTPGWWI